MKIHFRHTELKTGDDNELAVEASNGKQDEHTQPIVDAPVEPDNTFTGATPVTAVKTNRPSRVKCPTKRYGIDEVHLAEIETVKSALCSQQVIEATSMSEALSGADAKKWSDAAQAEMKSLNEHDTWKFSQLPQGRRLIGSKRVFKIKQDEHGSINRYKCRLVAQGYSQTHGIDYNETFAPMAKFSTIRTVLAVAVQRKMTVHQMDVDTAFLYGKLDEDIYMRQPEGFEVKGKENLVCHLEKRFMV